MRFFAFFLFLFVVTSCQQKERSTVFDQIFIDASDDFMNVIDQKDRYEVQILFSPIGRKEEKVVVEDYFFNFKPNQYFYPASTVKMPVAFLALQKLNELRKSGLHIDRNTEMRIDSVRPPQTSVIGDSTQAEYKATIGHYIDKLFVVSDNDAYNRLYEFCGSDYINNELQSKSIFANSRIVHRVGVGGFSYDENKHSPPIHFLGEHGDTLYTQDAMMAQGDHLTAVDSTMKGVAYIDSEGEKVERPFDFGQKNFINIRELQGSLRALVLPEDGEGGKRYDLSIDDRAFLMASMSRLPRQHGYLQDMLDEYYDGYVKFFMFGDTKDSIPEHIIIRNKVGFAYGYLTDCAYIQDTKEGVEYFLTATIHVNDNQTYNDGVYEYDEVGIPFLAELGRLVHDFMIKNKS